jgi:hypothetical protein
MKASVLLLRKGVWRLAAPSSGSGTMTWSTWRSFSRPRNRKRKKLVQAVRLKLGLTFLVYRA